MGEERTSAAGGPDSPPALEPMSGDADLGRCERESSVHLQGGEMNVKRILLAGAVGTAAMTMLMLVAPLMGIPKMAIGEMLGRFLGIGTAAGWVLHPGLGLS